MNDNSDDTIWELIEEFIEAANQKCSEHDPGVVSEALMYAASRFSAFVAAANSIDRSAFKDEQPEIERKLHFHFKDFLKHNLNDYAENYKVLIEKQRDDSEPNE